MLIAKAIRVRERHLRSVVRSTIDTGCAACAAQPICALETEEHPQAAARTAAKTDMVAAVCLRLLWHLMANGVIFLRNWIAE